MNFYGTFNCLDRIPDHYGRTDGRTDASQQHRVRRYYMHDVAWLIGRHQRPFCVLLCSPLHRITVNPTSVRHPTWCIIGDLDHRHDVATTSPVITTVKHVGQHTHLIPTIRLPPQPDITTTARLQLSIEQNICQLYEPYFFFVETKAPEILKNVFLDQYSVYTYTDVRNTTKEICHH